MLDVIFRDCITSEGDPNYQTNDAENNVIIEKFEKNYVYMQGTFGGPILEVVEACKKIIQ